MMTSPEEYVQIYLEGKTADQIMSKIRGLKREINRLIRVLEDPNYMPMICPSEDVQLSCTRAYLEEAKRALQEAGGTYTPTKAEEKEITLRENIPYISKITFSIGGFFGGYETRTITIDEDPHLHVDHSCFLWPSNLPSEAELSLTKEELFKGLSNLHLSQWHKRYDNINVLDGTQWALTIAFSNGFRTIHITGSNAYPYNFQALRELLGIPDNDPDIEYVDDEDEEY